MTKNNKRIGMIAALVVAASVNAMAQGNGLAGINEATSMVSSYFEPATKLVYAIGAVVGLIGGVKVYGKHLPHRCCNHPPLLLPLTLYSYNNKV